MRDRDEHDNQVLSDQHTARLLARASELDAARKAGSSVEQLRAAAAEAGISRDAFDAALSEMQRSEVAFRPEVERPVRPRRRRRWLIAAALGAAIAVGVGRMVVPVRQAPIEAVSGEPLVEEAILLRCLSTREAAQLIRPLMRSPSSSVLIAKGAPRVLTVRGTAEQLQKVKATLDQYENGGSCAVPAPGSPAR